MRGRPVSRTARKEIDVVLLAVRYRPEGHRISLLQGRERRGEVWGDVKLLNRESILAKIDEGKKVVTARQIDLEGDFEVFAPVQVHHEEGEDILFTSSASSRSDNLEIPLF